VKRDYDEEEQILYQEGDKDKAGKKSTHSSDNEAESGPEDRADRAGSPGSQSGSPGRERVGSEAEDEAGSHRSSDGGGSDAEAEV